MSVLSDRDIGIALAGGRVKVEPYDERDLHGDALGAELLGEREVVLHEGVLGPDATAHHAVAALGAARAVGTGTAPVGTVHV